MNIERLRERLGPKGSLSVTYPAQSWNSKPTIRLRIYMPYPSNTLQSLLTAIGEARELGVPEMAHIEFANDTGDNGRFAVFVWAIEESEVAA